MHPGCQLPDINAASDAIADAAAECIDQTDVESDVDTRTDIIGTVPYG